jgi:hypothetical protein
MGGADVAVLGGRPRRLDAEHDDAILLGGGVGQLAHLGERARIGDDVVGGKRDDHGAVVTLQRITGAGGDSRSGSRRAGSSRSGRALLPAGTEFGCCATTT